MNTSVKPSPDKTLVEVSATIDYFNPLFTDSKTKNLRGVLSLKPLIRYLHKNTRLPHDLGRYMELKQNFKFGDIKKEADYNSRKNFWLIIVGQAGSACVIPTKNGNWKMIVSTLDEGILENTYTRISTAIEWATNNFIGNILFRFQGEGPFAKTRLLPKKQDEPTIQDIYNRLQPLIDKIIDQAIADVRGMVITQLKNDAFEKAGAKIEKLNKLSSMKDQMTPMRVKQTFLDYYLKGAIMMTASHFYPEQTGTITTNRNYTYQSTKITGVDKIYSDIGKGDMKKIAAILYYLKRELVAG